VALLAAARRLDLDNLIDAERLICRHVWHVGNASGDVQGSARRTYLTPRTLNHRDYVTPKLLWLDGVVIRVPWNASFGCISYFQRGSGFGLPGRIHACTPLEQ
jgi:hypothetical protein